MESDGNVPALLSDLKGSPSGPARKFCCSICNRAFGKAEHLARHLRSHSKEKPFKCSCGKSFGRQDVLVRHQKLHLGEPTSGMWPNSTSGNQIQAPGDLHGDFAPDTNNLDLAIATQSLSDPLTNDLQPWGDSSDMLEFLLSDLNNSWPLAAPVMQFQPAASIAPTTAVAPHQTGPGHFAMQQMSKLIAGLSSSLTAEIEATGITSSFLDTCMHVFFEKFNPSFPVLHKPSFYVRESSHPLLLNIIALGSLFVGAKDALAKGEALWRLAHTAVATSWQALMATKGPRDNCKGVQLVLTALLGQTYAILSKNESLRMTSQVFHGLAFYWARQCGIYDAEDFQDADIPSIEAPEHEKLEAWRSWAAKEVMKRAVLGHYILDGQIAEFSGHPACTRHVINPLYTPAPDRVFAASTVDDWILAMHFNPKSNVAFREIYLSLFSEESNSLFLGQLLSNFAVRVVLEGLGSLASDIQSAGPAIGTPTKTDISRVLLKLQDVRIPLSDTSVENMELLVRFHSICLNLATPTTILCKTLCELYAIPQKLHQGGLAAGCAPTLEAWTSSVDGKRSLLHAMAIQDLVERLPLGRSHSIHLPTAIFAVATIYSARCLAGLPTVSVPKSMSWPDVWGIPESLNDEADAFLHNEKSGASSESTSRNLMYELNSLQMTLSAISLRWGATYEMCEILQRWISLANGAAQSSS